MRTDRLTIAAPDIARRLFVVMAEVFEEPCVPLGDAYLARLLARDDFWAIAAFDDAGDIIGGITAHTLPMTRAESAEIFIYDIAVRAQNQRQGVGRGLMEALRAAAAAIGIDDVFVPADDDDQHALDFYRALGGAAAPVTIFTFGAREG
jgi:aminoglycoside 3-N-acetyltransferase I